MNRRGLVLSVYLPSFLLSFANGLLIPTVPLYVHTFGVSFEVISIVVAAAGIGTVAGDIPAGLVVGRFGRRPAMLVGTGLLAATALALGLSKFVPELILFRLLSGSGTALWSISRHTVLTQDVTARERGRAIATFGGVNRVGTFAGPAVGGLVGVQFGLVAPFFVYAGVAFLAMVLAFLFVPESKKRSVQHAPFHVRSVGRLLVQHRRSFSTAGVAQIFAQMIRAGRQIIVPLYGAYVIGLDVGAVGAIVSASSAIDMSLFYPAGLIMDRFGRRSATIPSFLIQAIGMALIPTSHTYVGLLLATLVIGLGNGLGAGTMMTLGADLAPKVETGEFLGIWRLIGDVGGSGGPLVVGAIADGLGLGVAALALSGIGLMSVAMFVLFVQETLQRQPTKVT